MRRPSQALVTAVELATAWALARPAPVHATPDVGATTPAPAAAPVVVVVEAEPSAPGAAPPPVLDAAPASAAETTPATVVAASSEAASGSGAGAESSSEPADSPRDRAFSSRSGDDRPADKALSSGLALGTGVGSDNVFLGGHVAYYAQFPSDTLRVLAHAGGGVLYDDGGSFLGGVRGGLYVAYGLRHRLVLGIYGGTLDARSYALHGLVIGQRREQGVGFSAGWEWMHETGLYVRATVGPAIAFVPDTGLLQRSHRLLWQGNFFAVGYKLW